MNPDRKDSECKRIKCNIHFYVVMYVKIITETTKSTDGELIRNVNELDKNKINFPKQMDYFYGTSCLNHP